METIGTGWAGHDTDAVTGQNNPEAITIEGIGPLPPGVYTIGDPIDSPKLGPIAFPLTPDPTNQMFGRSEFYLHAPEVKPKVPDVSSDGCIIQIHDVRVLVASIIEGTPLDDPKRRLEVTLA
jgi:hypothetical protein